MKLTEHGGPGLVDNIEADRTAPGQVSTAHATAPVAGLSSADMPPTHISSMLGWKILFMKPMLGDL